MKITTQCKICISDGKTTHENNRYDIAINDSDVYEFECSFGHGNKFVLSNLKFETLFQSGVNALADGYYREASTSFYVGLERFFEFMIFASLVNENKVSSIEEFDKYFKFMSNQSERQLGAFYAMFYPVSEILFDNIYKKNIIELRNKIIHKGYIPTEDEVLQFGENIKSIIDTIWNNYQGTDFETNGINKAWALIKKKLLLNNGIDQLYGEGFYLEKSVTSKVWHKDPPTLRQAVRTLKTLKKIHLNLPITEKDKEEIRKCWNI